ncbi:Isochorismatase hydrolase [Coemansia reversa NRRL 1564]|uniref:Isochorismatase hydrolase n=1 Tax=Coemansia reversa (strain ATCC 12441 / NRRL 1564) TaxID=763665 RepID=A0A2G5BKR8_COERN|nr:Isochorismatase hydrolase [Coemansia reversa NRRL 1564]|eukprot:PIA19357.1 Isochorismatase hydrolase [Coemansia reversa NRRL 1564]
MSSRIAATSARRLGQLQRQGTVFFLCDIQEKFRAGIHAFESLVQVAQKMSRFAEISKIPLIATEQYPKGLGHTASEISLDHAELVEEKTKFSMLTPAVAGKLEELKTQSVVLFGIESHVCVLQTCLDLLALDYDVHVLADGVSSMNSPEIDIALNRMAHAGAHVVSSESIMFQLTGDSKDPVFKQISSLVKEYQVLAQQNKLLFKHGTAQL